MSNASDTGLSVVMPAYNAEKWIAPTLQKIEAALTYAQLKNAEIVLVDDGSSDETYTKALEISKTFKFPVNVIKQQNLGRFLARKNGVKESHYDTILFIDTRVWVDESSVDFALKQITEHPDRIIWNGHVNVAKEGNLIARFGDAITFIGWRRYFADPKLTSYGVKDFDYYPKGTGFFLAPKKVLLGAIEWFESVTNDVKHSSDDTLLIRHIAGEHRIWLSPEFSCTYHARTTLRAYIKHTYFRGQFFVDGFLRKGTRFYRPLQAFLLTCVATLVGFVMFPVIILPVLVIMVALWLGELLTALALGVNPRDAGSLFILSPVFAAAYGIGIWRAVLRKINS
jgi:glycosyltransferase involved in cell wall biosynthesis